MKLTLWIVWMTTIVISGFCGFASANPAPSSELEAIKSHMADDQFGEILQPSTLRAQYVGTCFQDDGQTKTEALYWNEFTNAEGKTADLGISTLQVYDGYELPSDLAFLLQPSWKSWDFITKAVQNGLSGTDNNLGNVGAGADFQYNYTSQATDRTLTVSVGQFRACSLTNDCNPPVLQGCYAGQNSKGLPIYQECIRQNDQTVFKKESSDTLISHRTAEGIGQPVNSLSFYLPAISTYCRWHRSNSLNLSLLRKIGVDERKQSCHSCGPQGYPGCQICD